MEINVNGEKMALLDGQSALMDVFSKIGIPQGQAGIAVAVNMELVPRSEWPSTVLKTGDSVEIITARQGG